MPKIPVQGFGTVALDWKTAAVIIGSVFLLIELEKYRVKKAAGAALSAVNPVNPENVINKGTVAVYQGVTGSEQQPGADFYDLTHKPDGSTSWYNPMHWVDKVVL